MENQDNQFNNQPQPEFKPVSVGNDFNNQQPKKKWAGALSLLVIIVAAVYFAGGGEWLDGKLSNTDVTEPVAEQKAEGLGDSNSITNSIPESGEKTAPVQGKGRAKIMITAGVDEGALLMGGDASVNIEVKKILFHNPTKDSWILVYEGVRPINLLQLNASGENHFLIETDLAALDYDKAQIFFSDVFSVSAQSGQNVSRDRTADLAGVVVKEGEENIINIRFSLDDPYRPLPRLAS